MENKIEHLKVKDLLEASKEMAAMIEERAIGMKKVTVKLDKGEAGVNTAAMYFDLQKQPYFSNFENYGYLHRRNRIEYTLKVMKYAETLR